MDIDNAGKSYGNELKMGTAAYCMNMLFEQLVEHGFSGDRAQAFVASAFQGIFE